jgi:hypothetical protein
MNKVNHKGETETTKIGPLLVPQIKYCKSSELVLEQYIMGFVRPKSDGLLNIRAAIKSI